MKYTKREKINMVIWKIFYNNTTDVIVKKLSKWELDDIFTFLFNCPPLEFYTKEDIVKVISYYIQQCGNLSVLLKSS